MAQNRLVSIRHLALAGTLVVAACGPAPEQDSGTPDAPASTTQPAADNQADFDPLRHGELLHIAEEHDIVFGADPDSDIQILEQGDQIYVKVSDEFAETLTQEHLLDMGFIGNEITFSRGGFERFVSRLHDVVHLVMESDHERHEMGDPHDNDHENDHDDSGQDTETAGGQDRAGDS